jgi:acyl carrier protein
LVGSPVTPEETEPLQGIDHAQRLCEQWLRYVSERRQGAELGDRVRCFGTILEMMRMAPTKDEVFEKVKEALVDALGVDDDEVTPEATMVGDLGAESIDFLDIVFRLEKGFNIEIPRSELFPEDILTNAEYVQDGRVTAAGIEKLKQRMPFVDLARFEENPAVQEFSNLLTVNDLCRYVESKVGTAE